MKIDGHLSLLQRDYNEFVVLSNNQSREEVLIRKAVKTTIQVLYDRSLFDGFPKTNKVLKDFLFATGRRLDLEKVNADVIQ